MDFRNFGAFLNISRSVRLSCWTQYMNIDRRATNESSFSFKILVDCELFLFVSEKPGYQSPYSGMESGMVSFVIHA